MTYLTSSSFSSRLFQGMSTRPQDLATANSALVLEAAARMIPTQVNAASIEKRLNEMYAEDPFNTKREFEYHLFQVVGEKKIAKQVELFKDQFEKTGIITDAALQDASNSIERVMSGEGKFSSNASHLLFSRTLNELQKIHPPAPEKTLTQRLLALTLIPTKPSEKDRNRSATIELIKRLMPGALEISSDDLIEPEEFNVDKWSSSSESSIDEEDLTSIYSALPTQTLYPQLDNRLVTLPPLDKSWMSETPVVTDPGIRFHLLVSYIDLSFAALLNSGKMDGQKWDSLPALVKKDALRHCIHQESCSGAAEELANRLFKTPENFELQLKFANFISSPIETGLSPEFVEEGERLLELYYSDKYSRTNLHKDKLICLDFYQEFLQLPPEPLFLQYVFVIAKAAGVQTADWTGNHWKKIDMIKLDIQALERCLHTKKEG